MLVIPAQSSLTEYELFIVLEDENFNRMKQHDPGVIPTGCYGLPYDTLKLARIHLCWCSRKEAEQILVMAQERKLSSIVKLLTRGFKYQPKLGDNNGPPQQICKN